MTNLTVRNIPNEVFTKIKVLSKIEKRSINNEILLLLEKSLINEIMSNKRNIICNETQIKIWENISGKWKDKKSTKKIISEIYKGRSKGRDINL